MSRPSATQAGPVAPGVDAGPTLAPADKGAGADAREADSFAVGRNGPAPATGVGEETRAHRDSGTGSRPALATDALSGLPAPFLQAAAAPGDRALREPSAALRDRATAPHVAEQLAAAVALRPDGAEVSLRPDELGHVRISIDRSAGETTVTLTADRPETLDLLRRHVDLLASELRGAGVHNCNFQFGQGQGGAAHGPPASFGQAEDGESVGPAEPPSPSSGPVPSVRGGGLDLRL
jgi:hypothetical protein